ncbi:MAG: hypothetical protein SynsKO_22320 [Synoicihabitans sp.]
MLFASKSKGVFIEITDHARRVMRADSSKAPMVIEALAECEPEDDEGWEQILEHFLPKNAPNGLLQANCGIYPAKRLVRHAEIDSRKVKEDDYISDFAGSKFRIETSEYSLALINASDGSDYDMSAPSVNEVIFAGVPSAEISEIQDKLIEQNIYPDRLEIGTLSCIGALVDYLRFSKIKQPVVMLELDMDIAYSFIVSDSGLLASRILPQGLKSMIPVVQKELGLKDEESARKLFFSNTFDFTGMGPKLITRLINELQSSIGFFEVQTGQSIGNVICPILSSKLMWLEGVVASQMGVRPLEINLKPWLESRGITFSADTAETEISRDWLGVLSLMPRYDAVQTEENEEQEE